MDNSNQRYKEFGDFLKTRRAKILPSQVGLPEGTRRRTPGLRREEVASLSGIGLTWYTWIEQGRPIQVSTQLLESLARTLMLDNQETIHLYTLAGQAPPTNFPNYDESVDPMLQHVLDSLEFSPALIMDARLNVIAWNDAASKLSLDYSKISLYKRNVLRIMFTNEEFKETFTDWSSAAQGMIARFRTVYSKFIDDPWIEELVNELKRESKEFNLWWSMHNVKTEDTRFKTIIHPVLGKLDFEETSLLIADNTSLRMTVFTPMAETDTKEKIKQFIMREKI
ncbi:helix-turn-helix transcriptional regulator [Clostridium folliculivorans]|uniref:Transcriptional regulator n=1 Tax=Clostridium folliculivorans TaxID=2886038 RepID=A0A9W5XYT1_9CLOT|nr:helix-turn-helix transcriptional regulator [Clostridium folliculivorans]GKU23442.1 transcriptional regulator [Clostridium folliculivorans]GKU29559.1 transcriptional regulator [Clostridium folliculivorans]